jgi:murein DD-endopeptidase MepM/ murein hydrolase activator NlpD
VRERGNHDHDGIDLRADEGTPIHAAEAGRAVYAGDELGDYGKVIIIKHGPLGDGLRSQPQAFRGRGRVRREGDVIAEVGDWHASAPHLHFEVRRNNATRDPQSCLP